MGELALRSFISKSENGDAQASHESRTAFATFIDPNAEITPETQWAFMRTFWHDLGYDQLPALSVAQYGRLTSVAEANPNHRILPTPLLSLAGRQAIAEEARVFPGQQFAANKSALRLPDEGTTYADLIQDPQRVVTHDGTRYALRYKTPSGELTDRSGYIAALKTAGQAVADEADTVWTFPVMDVQTDVPRVEDTAGHLYETIDPIVSPEALIVIQALHQAAGTPKVGGDINFANEAVYGLDEASNPAGIAYVASVRWRDDYHQIGSYARRRDSLRDYMVVRAAESGL
jgi:hypothetical protein